MAVEDELLRFDWVPFLEQRTRLSRFRDAYTSSTTIPLILLTIIDACIIVLLTIIDACNTSSTGCNRCMLYY